MHGGDIFETVVPYIHLAQCARAVYDRSLELSRTYGLEYVLDEKSPLPGAGDAGLTLCEAARRDGIPTLLSEVGGEGLLQP